jgi:hypothetical protein
VHLRREVERAALGDLHVAREVAAAAELEAADRHGFQVVQRVVADGALVGERAREVVRVAFVERARQVVDTLVVDERGVQARRAEHAVRVLVIDDDAVVAEVARAGAGEDDRVAVDVEVEIEPELVEPALGDEGRVGDHRPLTADVGLHVGDRVERRVAVGEAVHVLVVVVDDLHVVIHHHLGEAAIVVGRRRGRCDRQIGAVLARQRLRLGHT